MELYHLKLKRFGVVNYRSIKSVSLDNLDNMVWLAGRNNAGKSNLLDAFQFLADAAISFEHALASRGRELAQVIYRKRPAAKMEFLFEFVLAAEKRGELIQQLFARNEQMTADQAQATDFLSTLTLKIVIARDQVTEELTTNNLRGERSCLIFSITSTPQKTDILYGQLEELCQRSQDELPAETVVPKAPAEASQPFRLRLGRPESGAAFPISDELADGVRRQFTAMEWISPYGNSFLGEGRGPSPLAETAALPDVLQWAYNNKPSQFRRIDAQVHRLVPGLGRLHTPMQNNKATLTLIDSRDEDLIYALPQMSAGTRAVVALITKVMLAAPGAWICLEEPENGLHPEIQERLMLFLRAESSNKRIFGVTHSPAMAAACALPSLFLVRRDAENSTVAVPVTAENARLVAEDLGVSATFNFEVEAVVFVEQAEQVPVFEAWAKKHGFRIGVQFLSCDGADNLHYFANARIALSRSVRTVVMAVFGNGSTEARKTMTRSLGLAEEQIVTLDFPELEGCLLDAKAIRKAFPAITLSEEELAARLDPALVLLDQKKALRELLIEYKIGEYDGQLGGRIAEAMEKIPSDVAQLFAKIEASVKPFWEI
jgi:predicted ATPase